MRALLLALVVIIVASVGFNYWSSHSTRPVYTSVSSDTTGTSGSSQPISVDKARERAAELGEKAAEAGNTIAEAGNKAGEKVVEAGNKVGETVNEAAITTKIKAKMALDDLVKARDINVTTTLSTVTLTGAVHSKSERERAVRIAHETDGVATVIDQLQIKS